MKMANYSSNISAGDFPIDWDAWNTTSVPINTTYTISPRITTTGTTSPSRYVPNPYDLPNPNWVDSAILDSLRVPEEWTRLIEEQNRTQTEIQQREIQQRMALLEAEMRRAGTGLPVLKKVFPRKPLRMIRIREDAKKS